MKIILGQLKVSEPAFATLANSRLPASISYQVAKMLKAVSSELTLLEEQRIASVKKFGVSDPTTQEIAVSAENASAFSAEMNALISMEIDLPFEKINLVEHLGNIELKPAEIVLLEPFFDFE